MADGHISHSFVSQERMCFKLPTNTLGIRRQYRHTHLSPAVLDWYRHHFAPGGFHGRHQLGFRKAGERGIWPLCTGDYEQLRDFLESMHLSSKLDYYITANSFSGVERKGELLFSLNNFVVDIDMHSEKCLDEFDDYNTTEDVLDDLIFRLECDLFSCGAPSPTATIYTGRGVQLWWHITPISVKCETWYREIHRTLILAIKDVIGEYFDEGLFEVDGGASQNEAGYFRLPGTMNTLVAKPVIIKNSSSETHNTHEMIKWAKTWKEDNIVPASPPPPTADFSGKYKDSDVYIMKNLYTTGFFRVRQMIQLRLLRDNDVGAETRNNMCFIVYNALLPAVGHDKAWDKLLAFNSGFKQPMTEKELHQTVDTAQKKNGYKYKNDTLISFLGVTPAEQDAIGLYPTTKPFSPFSKVTPNASQREASKTIKEDRNAKIAVLSRVGYSKSEIARQLHLNRDTVASVLSSDSSPPTTQYDAAVKLFERGETNPSVEKNLGVCRRTVIRYRQKWKCEKNAGG